MMVALVIAVLSVSALPDGSLIFSEHSSVVVEKATNSPITHVAIAFNESGTTYVYQATLPRVKKTTLDEYFDHIKKLKRRGWIRIKVWVAQPNKPYTKEEIAAMKSYADSQLGEKYSVKSYTGKQSNGIHCSEYVTKSLTFSNRYTASSPGSVSPKSLWKLPGYNWRLKID